LGALAEHPAISDDKFSMRSNPIGWLVGRSWRWASAWVIGGLLYFVGVMVSPYAGFETLICQPPMAICISGVFVVLAAVVGLSLALPGVGQVWSKATPFSLVLLIAGFVLLFFSQTFGLTATLIEPETNTPFVGPHPLAILVGYFLVIFAIVNWPSKSRLV